MKTQKYVKLKFKEMRIINFNLMRFGEVPFVIAWYRINILSIDINVEEHVLMTYLHTREGLILLLLYIVV